MDSSTLGPNEARVLFDLLLAAGASAATIIFLRTFFPGAPAPLASTMLLLPGAFLVANLALGIYSYLKLAPSGSKGLALGGSVAITGVLAWLVGLPPAVIVLWVLLTLPTAIIARLLLGLPYSRRAPLNRLAVTRHGPVLVIGGAGYIGSLTVERLLQRGHRVRVLDRMMYGSQSLVGVRRLGQLRAARRRCHGHFQAGRGDAARVGGDPSGRPRGRSRVCRGSRLHPPREHHRDPHGEGSGQVPRHPPFHFFVELLGLRRVGQGNARRRRAQPGVAVRANQDRQRERAVVFGAGRLLRNGACASRPSSDIRTARASTWSRTSLRRRR